MKQGFSKKLVKLADGRRLIYYDFPTTDSKDKPDNAEKEEK